MKLGVYVQTWHVGGVAAFCERLASGLARMGHQPCLILSTPFGKRDEAGRKAFHRLMETRPFPVHCMHLHAFHPKERPWRAADRIAELNCDALLLSSHGALAGAWERLAPMTPLIGIGHNDDPFTYDEFEATEQFCDAYVAVSLAIAETFQGKSNTAGSSIRHIPYGVPITDGTEPILQSPNPGILVVCRLEQEQKRVLDLPSIWANYRERGGQGVLTICGSGNEEARLKQAFNREIASGGVRMLGPLSLEQMPAIYAAHDILLSVSAYEGLPISVLEATTQGLAPVLSSIRSGHREIVDAVHAGRLCPPGDISSFAGALLEAGSDLAALREQRRSIREAACARYSLNGMVDAYSKLAQEICDLRAQAGLKRSEKNWPRPRVDFIRAFLRKWKYRRYYGGEF